VDGITEEAVKLEDLKPEDLPEEMRDMTLEEQRAYVEKKAEERAEIQEQIRKLHAERRAYVAAERKKLAEAGEATFDEALVKAARAQAEARSFAFEK
jgi:hypothetical protein